MAGVGSATVDSITLRLFVTDPSADGGTVSQTTTGWAENTLKWSNQPALGTTVGAVGNATAGTFVDVSLSPSLIAADGTISVAISGGTTDSTIYSSREGTQPPQLVVTVGG